MPNLNTLKRQHHEIIALIETTERKINIKTLDENALDLAKSINELSGKLKIHLSHEDKYLYPNFKKSGHLELKNKANHYMKEMGDLNAIFIGYKNNFNTRSKILKHQKSFIHESKAVFNAIKKRITKEDQDLYILAENI